MTDQTDEIDRAGRPMETMRDSSEMVWEGGRADHEVSVAKIWKWIRGVVSMGMPEKRLPTHFFSSDQTNYRQ